jgi:O-antigen/teichoic acid export membrane protein
MILKKYFSEKNVRSTKALKNIISSFIIKGISIVINLALIPLTINYLSPTKYGVWLTISSIIGWLSFFDIGLGHGLRNKLAEAIAKDDMRKAKSYVSTAYLSISIFCFVLFALFLIINQFLNWNTLLNIPAQVDEDLKKLALIIFSMFSIQFILQLINSILLGSQQSAKVSLFNMISNLIVLIAISILMRLAKESLFYVAFIFSITPVLTLAVVNIYYFKNNFKEFSPNIKSFDFRVLKDVLNLGIKFFIIQVSVLIFYQTSNLLICRYFSPELVTPYNIAFRYFGIITMIFSIITSPYWSAYTEAYIKQDIEWIKKSINQIIKTWLILVVIAILMLIFSEYAYHLWVGDKVKIDFKLSLFMMLYTIVISFGNIYIMVLNGIGKIKLQMIVNIIGMIIFIPLSYFLAVTLKLGIVGIIISTIICSAYGAIIAPFEVRKVLAR